MVISNAKRLVRDAVLLKDHERYASAYALAILGLEEIGKVILKRWGEPDKEETLAPEQANGGLVSGSHGRCDAEGPTGDFRSFAIDARWLPARCKGCNGGRNGSFQRDSQ